MPLTMREFGDGVEYWLNKTGWPAELHNAFYGRLADQNPHGEFTEKWWRTFVPQLRAWKALRPMTTAELTRHTVPAFPALRELWSECCAPVAGLDIP